VCDQIDHWLFIPPLPVLLEEMTSRVELVHSYDGFTISDPLIDRNTGIGKTESTQLPSGTARHRMGLTRRLDHAGRSEIV
jgi:hypothetical protein